MGAGAQPGPRQLLAGVLGCGKKACRLAAQGRDGRWGAFAGGAALDPRLTQRGEGR